MNQFAGDNPYASPKFSGDSPSAPPEIAVRGPAIGLLIVQSSWLLFMTVSSGIQIVRMMPIALNMMDLDAARATGQIVGMILFPVVFLGVIGFSVYGAVCMLRMQSWTIALIGAIISLIPVCSGCYIVGIPFGIWALIVLSKPEVRGSFR